MNNESGGEQGYSGNRIQHRFGQQTVILQPAGNTTGANDTGTFVSLILERRASGKGETGSGERVTRRVATRSVAHLIILSNEGVLVLIVFGRLLGLQTSLGQGFRGGVVNTYSACATSASVDDRVRVDLFEVVLLYASNAWKWRISQC